MKFGILGPLEVIVGEQRVPIGGEKPRAELLGTNTLLIDVPPLADVSLDVAPSEPT